MKEKMFKNFSLKVLSIVCAIILWAIIVNVNDPNTGYTFSNVTVQLINTESLTNMDYTYEVVDGGKISVYVSGPKSIVTDLKSSDIVATADLSKITAFADYVDIDVQVIKDGQVQTGVEATPRTTALKLNIENRVSQNFDISIQNTGVIAEGYSMISQSISPNNVRITGSSSLVASIQDVKVVVDVNGVSSDISGTMPIALYDSEGNQLSMEGMELSKTEVDYYGVVQTSKTVPIRYSLSGSAAEGYSVLRTHISQENAIITGSTQSLEKVNEIVIPSSVLNISELNADRIFTIDLTSYIPEGIVITSDKSVKIDVIISEANSREMELETSKINFVNVPSGMTASIIGDKKLNIIVSGDKEIVDAISADDIEMSADLTGLSEGTNVVNLVFTLPTGCTVTKSYSVSVSIQKSEQNTTTTPTTTAGY